MNIDSNSEQAIRRDRFMSLWKNVSEAFLYNNAKAVQIALTEAVLEYAAPELELPGKKGSLPTFMRIHVIKSINGLKIEWAGYDISLEKQNWIEHPRGREIDVVAFPLLTIKIIIIIP